MIDLWFSILNELSVEFEGRRLDGVYPKLIPTFVHHHQLVNVSSGWQYTLAPGGMGGENHIYKLEKSSSKPNQRLDVHQARHSYIHSSRL